MWFLLRLLRLRSVMPSRIECKYISSSLPPPLSWIPPWTQNKSMGGCRQQSDLLTFRSFHQPVWFIKPFCTCESPPCSTSVHGRPARSITCLIYHSCWFASASAPQSVSSWLRVWWGKNGNMSMKTTQRKVFYGLIYIRWVKWLDNWFSQAPVKAWTHKLLSN